MKINPVRFSYKGNNPRNLPSSSEYIGLVAQDVQLVIPEAVAQGSPTVTCRLTPIQ